MGRRIQKSKRHKKIKAVDPFYTGTRKQLLDRKAHLANDKPQNVDEQEIPRKLQELMDFKNQAQNSRKRKRRKQTEIEYRDYFGEEEPGMNQPLKPVPVFKKSKKESMERFLHRVNSQTHAVLEKTKMEEKFGVDVVEKPGGKVELKKKEKLSFELPQKLTQQKHPIKKSDKVNKKKEKVKLKKQKKLEKKLDEFQTLKDEVKFGEVVTAPPSLMFKKGSSSSDKPGKKSLLLKQLLQSERNQSIILPVSESKTVDRTVKRKFLSLSDRRQLDAEREKVITAYRSAKKQLAKKDEIIDKKV